MLPGDFMVLALVTSADTPDIRPDLMHDAVIVRAVQEVDGDLALWVSQHVVAPASMEELSAIVAVAIKEGAGDGFRSGVRLHALAGWPVDMECCRILGRACDAIPFARKLMVQEWVMRTGIRFPAKVDDQIEWRTQGRIRKGLVYAVVPTEAAAIVKPMVGVAISGEVVRVVAEQVTKNITTAGQKKRTDAQASSGGG